MGLSPSQRSARSRLGAYVQHARHDPALTTKAAREAFRAKFLDEVDPTGELRATNPAEAERRAESARKAHYARLSYLAALARSARRKAVQT